MARRTVKLKTRVPIYPGLGVAGLAITTFGTPAAIPVGMKAKKPAQLDREIAVALSKQPGSTVLPLTDAKLAVDIAAVRDQISQLCERLRYDSRTKPQAVLAQLDDAQSVLGDALGTVLTVRKS